MALMLYTLVKSAVKDGLSDEQVLRTFSNSSPCVIEIFIRAARQGVREEKESFLKWLKEDEKLHPDK